MSPLLEAMPTMTTEAAFGDGGDPVSSPHLIRTPPWFRQSTSPVAPTAVNSPGITQFRSFTPGAQACPVISPTFRPP